MEKEQGKLYIVATPIGNLEDITLRALRVLKEADIILAEDTRVARKLLSHYEIKTPVQAYHAHTQAKHEAIAKMVEVGKIVAVISDAGTPGISDPGETLVAYIRDQFGSGAVAAIPGPSALGAALSIAGIPVHQFIFVGFLPHKKGRQTMLQEICDSERTMVFYESTHRIMKALEFLSQHLPAERTIVVARELTKMFEETIVGTAADILNQLQEKPERQKGEFVVLVQGKTW